MHLVGSTRWACAAILLILGSFGCSAPVPAAIKSAEHLEIGYYGFRPGETSFLLVSEEDPTYADVATTSRAPDQINVKRAPAELMRELADFAASKDFFVHAQDAQPEDLIQPATKAIIMVRGDGKPHSMALALPMEHDMIQDFTDVARELGDTFRMLPGLQYVDAGSRGNNYFSEQQRKLEEENRRRGGSNR